MWSLYFSYCSIRLNKLCMLRVVAVVVVVVGVVVVVVVCGDVACT